MARLLTALLISASLSAIPAAIEQYLAMRRAQGLGASGNHAGAAALYRELVARHPNGPFHTDATFNLAVEEYAQGKFLPAAERWGTLRNASGTFSRNAAYNRGNALAAEAFARPSRASAREHLAGALAGYRQALLKHPDDTDARINYEIVLRALLRRNNAPSGGGGGGDRAPAERQKTVNSDVSNLILEEARQEESRMMRSYFRPARPEREKAEERADW